MKTIQFTVQVPDDVTAIDQLELYVDHLGQKLKRELFSKMLRKLHESEDHTDSSESPCPECKKNETLVGAADQED